MNTLEIETAIAMKLDIRKHIIVPNISWGAGLHECDLLVINKSGYATEIEIKISKSDLKKDFTKNHNHYSEKIKNLYYAVPKFLLDEAIKLVPSHAGIIVVEKLCYETFEKIICTYARKAKPIHKYRALTDSEILKICKLGCMRIWRLKNKLVKKAK